mmetsp:Transcript_108075/g.345150  ORF Transcript_108075/g.345150 Transcript_108075/m.345150 type:complete len:211 (-) Transcript_108075:1246-1878(-)
MRASGARARDLDTAVAKQLWQRTEGRRRARRWRLPRPPGAAVVSRARETVDDPLLWKYPTFTLQGRGFLVQLEDSLGQVQALPHHLASVKFVLRIPKDSRTVVHAGGHVQGLLARPPPAAEASAAAPAPGLRRRVVRAGAASAAGGDVGASCGARRGGLLSQLLDQGCGWRHSIMQAGPGRWPRKGLLSKRRGRAQCRKGNTTKAGRHRW